VVVQIKQISAAEHLSFIESRNSVSFLQTPAWGKAKSGWQSQSLGWFDQDQIVGAGLVLLRKVPKVKKYLAYLPEGPDLDWTSPSSIDALDNLVNYLKSIGVFQIKIGPHIWVRRWQAETIKEAIAENKVKRIGDLPADDVNQSGLELIAKLKKYGWHQPKTIESGFGDYQPRFVFQINLESKSEEELLTSFNQLWRRNIKKAEKEGVTVRVGTEEDLALFHTCYVETAKRDRFTPRSLSYFKTMWAAMRTENSDRIKVFIAEHPDYQGAIAATTLTRVGKHSWYSYGASTTAARDLRPSNAIQWAMLKDSLESGSSIYDMRGISDTLDQNNHLFGLIQFKLGTSGYAQEYVGEWDYVISKPWATAFSFYMSRR
jgi:lipid II:glycine glycyltransferase (peptidoglycan interpeptide bridge formation enzyme)